MNRWAITLVWVWSACVAFGQPAVAHARGLISSELSPLMCDEGAQTLVSVELGPARRTSESLSGRAIFIEERGTAGPRAAAAGAEEQPAWCVSPDDPRCAPRDAGAPVQVQRAQAPVSSAHTLVFPRPVWPIFESPAPIVVPGAARGGVLLVLERPPQR
jgi:hypothetical protein